MIAGAAAATLCPGNKLVVERPESSDGRAERLGTWPPGRLAGLLPVEPRSPGPPHSPRGGSTRESSMVARDVHMVKLL